MTRREWAKHAQQERLASANEFLRVIAANGRHFFAHEGRVSQLELDERGRVWLIDKYTQKRVYTHYNGHWREFSEGGTLREVIVELRIFIKRGVFVNRHRFGPWPNWLCGGDLWGYGDDMAKVREAAVDLGMVRYDSYLVEG